MAASDPKADLQRYLQDERDALVWKLEGLSEYDIRRPLVGTGTNLLVRVATETSRHAGHADIIRELIDGAAGLTAGRPSLPPADQAWWQAHHDRVERTAREAATGSSG